MKYTALILASAVIAIASLSVNAQEVEYPESFDQPMPLFPDAMGDFYFPISSSNELAQEYFNQGFQLMYSFAKNDSARSFQASRLADPDCAICWWGEAWSWGTRTGDNGALRATVSSSYSIVAHPLYSGRDPIELWDRSYEGGTEILNAAASRETENTRGRDTH